MKLVNIHLTRYAAEELIRRIDDYEKRLAEEKNKYYNPKNLDTIDGTAESAALRRQSMELSRRLTEMRKPYCVKY
ncbi:MAG: hypothetical protein RR091_10285 [Cloacibacillus sp.]